MKLQQVLLSVNWKDEYDSIPYEIFRLLELKHQLVVDTVTRYDHISCINELQDFIKGQPTDVTEFDEKLVKRLMQKITGFEDHFTVESKSGVTIYIEA